MTEKKKYSIFRGNKLKNLRIEKNLTQQELAGHLEVTRQLINQLEKGKPMSVKMMNKLAEFYSVDVHWLNEDAFSMGSYKRYKATAPPKLGLASVSPEERLDNLEEKLVKYITDLTNRYEEVLHRLEKLEQCK